MVSFIVLQFVLFLLRSFSVKANELSIPEYGSEDIRSPRVSGRIVKVYSGSRPDPSPCRAEGFQADPDSCITFYRCVPAASGKFTVFRYQCGPGTVYDPDKEICNHPQNTRRSECGGTFASEHNNQNEISPSRPININENNQWWSQSQISPHPAPSTTPKLPITAKITTTINPWLKPALIQETTTKKDLTNTICTSDGFVGDKEDCRKFYRCVGNVRGGFIKYEYSCSIPTIWDDDIQACNHAWAVRRRSCGRSITDPFNQFGSRYEQTSPAPMSTRINTGTLSPPNYLTLNDTSHAYDEISTSNEDNIICTSNGFVGDPRNCRIFYKCVNNGNGRGGYTKHQYKCKQGTVWDPETETCNFEWAVKNCGRPKLQTTTKTYTSPNPPKKAETTTRPYHENKQYQTSPVYLTNIPQKNVKSDTNDNCTSSGFMGSKNDCKKFYRCVDNGNGGFTRFEFTCGEGTVWDSNAQVCNHAWAVENCGGNSDYQKEPTTKSPSTVDTSQHNCNNDTDTSTQTSQDNTGTTALTTTTTTEKDIEETTTIKPQYNGVCTSEGFTGDSNECKKFYRCVDDGKGGYIKYDFTCGDGTVWDPKLNACNHPPANGGCKNDINKQPLSDTEYTTSQTNHENIEYVTETTSSIETTTSKHNSTDDCEPATKKPEPANGECKSEGFHGDPKDCRKFYRCVNSGEGKYTKYEFICGDGTVWDSNINSCNHPPKDGSCNSNSEPISEATTKQPDENISTVTNPSITESTTSSEKEQTTTSKKPTTTSGKCKSEGYFGDPYDCKKFYRCVDNGQGSYTKYDFSCGDGTVWDSEINSCNHPPMNGSCSSNSEQISVTEAATKQPDNENGVTAITSKPNESTTSLSSEESPTSKKPTSTSNQCKSEGFFGDPNDCKKFYRCVDNGQGSYIRYDFSCGDGTVWDTDINACNHPSDNNTCKSSSTDWSNIETTTKPDHISDEIITETSSTESSTQSEKECDKETTSKKPESSSGHCEAEGFYGDVNDCKKFYRCVDDGKGGYIKYDFTCGDGTVWDDDIQGCNHESDTKNCSKSSSHSTSSPSQSENIKSTTEGSDNDTEKTTQQPQSGPSNDVCSSDGFFADSNDCRKFYRCVDNGKGSYIKYEFICGTGTVWVQEIQACDHDDGDQTCSKNNTTVSHVTEQTSTDESVTPEMKPQKPEQQHDDYPEITSNKPASSNKCSSEGFYQNKNDCRQFYRCVDDGKGGYVKYDFTCGEGTAWDSDANTCNHISEVKNCDHSPQQNNEDQSKPVSQDEDQHQTSTTTQSSSTSTQNSKPSNKNTCEQEGYYGNKDECKKFYRCVDNGNGGYTKYDFTCGDGTIWDQDITTCNHPESVTNPSCQQSSYSSSASSSSTTTSSSVSSSSTTTEKDSSSSSQSSSTAECDKDDKDSSKKDVNCTEAGYYPDPNDCKKFYRCVDWNNDGTKFSVFWFECGEGTIWDPALDTCNHEDSVYPRRDCKSESMSSNEQTTEKESTSQESTSQQTDSTSTQEYIETTTTEGTTDSHESTTSESNTKQTTEQTTTNHYTTEQSTTESTTTESDDHHDHTTSQQTTHEDTTTEQSNNEHTTTEQTASEHTTEHSYTHKTTEDNTEKSTTNESTTEESTDGQHSTTESTTEKESTTGQTDEHETTTNESTENDSTTSQTNENETTEHSTTDSPTSEDNEHTTEASTESNDKCPKTEDGQHFFVCPTSFRRHPKYCNLFYQCTEDEDTYDVNVTVFKCPNNTIYDEEKTKCVEESKASKKCDEEIAQRRFKRYSYNSHQPMELPNKSLKCKKSGYKSLGNDDCSPVFMKCEESRSGKLEGLIYGCPDDYLFWSVSRRCERKSKLKFCKNSNGDNWNGRWHIPIERRNVAP